MNERNTSKENKKTVLKLSIFYAFIIFEIFYPHLLANRQKLLSKSKQLLRILVLFLSEIPLSRWLTFLSVILLAWVIQQARESRKDRLLDKAIIPQNAIYSNLVMLRRWISWLNTGADVKIVITKGFRVRLPGGLYFAPIMLFGQPVGFRKVLRNPPILKLDIVIHTDEYAQVQIEVDAIYKIIRSKKIVKEDDPVSKIKSYLKSDLRSLWAGEALDDIVATEKDTVHKEQMREIQKKLNKHFGYYSVKLDDLNITNRRELTDLLKKKLETRVAREQAVKNDIDREETIKDAKVQFIIDKAQAYLDDWKREREHERTLEELGIKKQHDIRIAYIDMARELARFPQDQAADVLLTLENMFMQSSFIGKRNLSRDLTLAEREETLLINYKPSIGFISLRFDAHPRYDRPLYVELHFEDYSFEIHCQKGYPKTPPRITVKSSTDEWQPYKLKTSTWMDNSCLADAVFAANLTALIKMEKLTGGN